MKHIFYYVGAIFIGIIIVAAGVALEGFIIMSLWNWLMVTIFEMQPITWMMGCGIGILLSFIGGCFKVTVKS